MSSAKKHKYLYERGLQHGKSKADHYDLTNHVRVAIDAESSGYIQGFASATKGILKPVSHLSVDKDAPVALLVSRCRNNKQWQKLYHTVTSPSLQGRKILLFIERISPMYVTMIQKNLPDVHIELCRWFDLLPMRVLSTNTGPDAPIVTMEFSAILGGDNSEPKHDDGNTYNLGA